MSVKSIGIVGSGTMGSGIAHVAAKAGLQTVLVKLTAGDLGAVRKKVEGGWKKEVEKGKLDAAGLERAQAHLSVTADLAALAECDLVLEAVIEDLGAKRELLSKLEGIVGARTIL